MTKNSLVKKLGIGATTFLVAGMTYFSAPKPADAGEIALELMAGGREQSIGLTYTIPFGGPKYKSKIPEPEYSNFKMNLNSENKGVDINYTSNGLKEFFLGMPSIFYKRPDKPGGFLSPVLPSAWKKNPHRTAGALTAELIILYLLTKKSGSSESPYNEPPITPDEPTPEIPVVPDVPVPEPPEPIVEPDEEEELVVPDEPDAGGDL